MTSPRRSQEGNSWRGAHLILWLGPSPKSKKAAKWHIVVYRKMIPLAVKRNLWKRRIREVLRRNKKFLPAGHQASLKVHEAEKTPRYSEMEKEILNLLHQAGL